MSEGGERIALVDLDGTLADYDTSMQMYMRFLCSPSEPEYYHRPSLDEHEAPHLKARRKLIQRQDGFWRELAPLHAGFKIVQALREVGPFLLHVLTKGPTGSPNAWGEKVEWCKKYLPDALVTISGDKSLVYGRVLVDDWPPYFEGWLGVRPRGLVVCVAHPWNSEYSSGGKHFDPRVIRYDGSHEADVRLRGALQKAYDREVGRE